MPGWKGHLNAFRRSDNGTPTDLTDDISVQMWDAGDNLNNRFSTTGMGPPATTCATPGTGCYTFAQLYGDATDDNPLDVADSREDQATDLHHHAERRQPGYNPTNLLAERRPPRWPGRGLPCGRPRRGRQQPVRGPHRHRHRRFSGEWHPGQRHGL